MNHRLTCERWGGDLSLRQRCLALSHSFRLSQWVSRFFMNEHSAIIPKEVSHGDFLEFV